MNETKRKLCPMTFSNPADGTECEMDKCAWWHGHIKECAILILSASINHYINEKLYTTESIYINK